MRNTRQFSVPLAGIVHAGEPTAVEVFGEDRRLVLLEIVSDDLRAIDRRLRRGAICSLDPNPPTTIAELLSLRGQIVAARYPDGLLVGRFYPHPDNPRIGRIRYGVQSFARVRPDVDLLGLVSPSEPLPRTR